MPRIVFAVLLGLSALAGRADAQAVAPAKKRPFDAFSGIIVACQPASQSSWTEQSCAALIADVKRRAGLVPVAVSAQPHAPDIARRVFGETGGFDGDKAIRMVWTFTDSTEKKGRVNLALASNIIWSPTSKEVRGAVPGQRIMQNFYSEGASFEPGATASDAAPVAGSMMATFFEFGEGKL